MFEKRHKDFKPYELHEFVYGVVSAISQAKASIDHTVIKQREKLEEELGEGLTNLIPPTTFKIEEVEINLKYNIEPLSKDEKSLNEDGTPKIMISPYSEKLSGSSDASIQNLKFKIVPKVLKKYDVDGKTKLKYE